MENLNRKEQVDLFLKIARKHGLVVNRTVASDIYIDYMDKTCDMIKNGTPFIWSGIGKLSLRKVSEKRVVTKIGSSDGQPKTYIKPSYSVVGLKAYQVNAPKAVVEEPKVEEVANKKSKKKG